MCALMGSFKIVRTPLFQVVQILANHHFIGALRYSSNNTSKWLYYNSYSLKVYEIRHYLVGSRYPVHLVYILTDRFANGFLLHHPGQMNNLMSISNIVSLELEQMLWDKINFEIDKRRIMGPFVSPPFNSFHIPPYSLREYRLLASIVW